MKAPIYIDGSMGEGGGQILRSALALSSITGKPFVIDRIRARRPRPGLLRQHFSSVQGAAAICDAQVEGLELGSTKLTFTPGTIKGGEFHLPIGSAGSTTLVLQTIILPLILGNVEASIWIEGGTHNPFSPPFEFITQSYLPVLERMGAIIEIKMERAGFYPSGGGSIRCNIKPAVNGLRHFELRTRGKYVDTRAQILACQLPPHVTSRERVQLLLDLDITEDKVTIRDVGNGFGSGNIVYVQVEHENVTEVFSVLGERGKSAENVAKEVADEALSYLKMEGAVGEYLADQLLLPMALVGSGSFTCTAMSSHLLTNIDVIKMFLDVEITITENAGKGCHLVTVR